jgi:hypothetical protein
VAVAYVSAQSSNNTGTGTSITVTPGTAIAIGSLVVATVGYQFTSTTNNTIPISAGSDIFTVETAVNIQVQQYFFTVGYFINTTASHTTVTATTPTGATFSNMTVNTFSGFGAGTLHAKSAPATTSQGNPSGANVITTGTFTASAGDLLVAAALDLNGAGTVSAGTTLAWQAAQSIAGTVLAEYILSSAGGTPAATWGNTSTSDNRWGVAAYSFTPAAAAGGCIAGSLPLLGVGCGIWAAKKIEENPVVLRRRLISPR